MSIRKFLLPFLLVVATLAPSARAQVIQSRSAPDCDFSFDFTATGRQPAAVTNQLGVAGFDNRTVACTTWHIQYYSEGFSALSIELDEAPSAAGIPGSWVVWPNVASGALPLTSTTSGNLTLYKYFPFVSVNLNSVTGTGAIHGHALGYRPFNSGDSNSGPQAQISGGGAPAGSAPVGNPVVVAGVSLAGNVQIPLTTASPNFGLSVAASSGTSAATMESRAAIATTIVQTLIDPATTDAGPLAVESFGIDPCQASGVAKLHAFQTITTATTTALVAVSASTTIFVCEVDFEISGTTTAGTVLFEQGTGVACATAPVSLTATYTDAGSTIVDLTFHIGNGAATAFKTAAANGLCAVTTVGTAPSIPVDVTYVQQ